MTEDRKDEQPKDKDLAFWQALHNVIADVRQTLPYATEPDTLHWDHPDDDWKNGAEIKALEEEVWSDTDLLLVDYCQKRVWPKRSKNNARFFAEKRLKWAMQVTRIFTITDGLGHAAIPRPPQSGWDLLKWLLIDVYPNRYAPAPKAPFVIGGLDGTVKTIYT